MYEQSWDTLRPHRLAIINTNSLLLVAAPVRKSDINCLGLRTPIAHYWYHESWREHVDTQDSELLTVVRGLST